MFEKLFVYTLTAMLTWVPLARHARLDPSEDATRARYESIATAIVHVVLDPAEAPLYREPTDDAGRARSALLLAVLAWFEGNYLARVDEGRCLPKECDNGAAVTLWQLHPDGGFVLRGDVYSYHRIFPTLDSIGPVELLADREVAARVALHIARESLQHHAGLCRYTGEGAKGEGCPKANDREGNATRYFRAHPFDPTEDVGD
jgi:hypothetical protein